MLLRYANEYNIVDNRLYVKNATNLIFRSPYHRKSNRGDTIDKVCVFECLRRGKKSFYFVILLKTPDSNNVVDLHDYSFLVTIYSGLNVNKLSNIFTNILVLTFSR